MAEQRKINKEVHVTGFSGKHITDLDYTFNIDEKVNFPANCHTESMGFRFINKDGQGFIAVIIEGNEETFQLTSGFIPLGSVTQNGILYIISHNPTTTAGEIGCYPSPITAAGGFERVYKPLYNLDIGNAFRSTSFTLNLLYQCSVIAKDSYDGTVDLYISDYYHSNRVINNGFDRNGVAVIGRHYTTAQLSSMIYHIPHTPSATRITSMGLSNGGNLKCGNYFFFIRYVTASLDPTHFVVHSNACQIDDGNRQVFNTDGGYTTGSKIVSLGLTGVDTTYSFIEVAYVRYYSDPNGVVNRESYLINKKYEITGAAMIVDITGYEGDVIISDVDALLQKNSFDICRDHVIIDNRYWGANWKQNSKHRDAFSEFARRIAIKWSTEIIDGDRLEPDALLATNGQYKLYEYTYGKVGYFRTEAYPYGIVFEFNDGSESQVYPLCGNDGLTKTALQLGADYFNGTDINYDGIFRFPQHSISSPYPLNLGGNDLYVLAVTFDLQISINGATTAKAYHLANASEFTDVKGFYFVRGERKKTLELQGIMIGACDNLKDTTAGDVVDTTLRCSRVTGGVNRYYNTNQFGAGVYRQAVNYEFVVPDAFWGYSGNLIAGVPTITRNYYGTQHVIPLYRGYMPALYIESPNGYYYPFTTRFWLRENHYGFFSPDMLLNYPGTEYNLNYIRRVGKTITNPVWHLGSTNPPSTNCWMHNADYTNTENILYNINPIHLLAEQVNGYSNVFNPGRNCTSFKYHKVGDIEHAMRSNSAKFINRTTDFTDLDNVMYYHYRTNAPDAAYKWCNRPVLTAPYIAIELQNRLDNVIDPDYATHFDDFNLDIVNIYNTNIDDVSLDITDWFGENIQYHRISNIILNGDIAGYNIATKHFNGDCFLQRTYFKHTWWTEDGGADAEYDTFAGMLNTHGVTLSIVTENAINTAMRNHFDDHEYYPHMMDHIAWITRHYNDEYSESYQMNNGYNQTLAPKFYYRFNANIPQVLNYDTRIYYSEKHIENSIRNYLRDIKIGNYKDFNKVKGPIIALFDVMGWLVSVQKDCINQHYINEKQYQLSDEAIAIGTGLVLPANVKQLAEFGSEHRFGCYEKYGVDVKRRVIWRVGLASSDARGIYPVAENLTLMTMNQKWIYDYLETYFPLTDILLTLPDNPVFTGGIHLGYDAKYKDIMFTFIIPDTIITIGNYHIHPTDTLLYYCNVTEFLRVKAIVDANNGIYVYTRSTNTIVFYHCSTDFNIIGQYMYFDLFGVVGIVYGSEYFVFLGYKDKKTFVFNEDINWFTGNYPFTPHMYFSLNKEFFSYIREYLTYPQDIYRHNIDNVFLRFYGAVAEAYLTPVINGQHFLDKVFDHVVVECPDQLFLEIDYRTRTQTSSHTPFERRQTGTRPWIDAMYKEDKFYFPVMPELVSGTRYRQMRGPWMTIKLRFQQNIAFFIKNLLTYFRKSES